MLKPLAISNPTRQRKTTCKMSSTCRPYAREPPHVGLAPTALWRVPPPPGPPRFCWRTLPSNHSPSLPTLPLPLPPTPLALFADALGERGLGMHGGGVLGQEGGGLEGEVPPSSTWGQTHIWGHSICLFQRVFSSDSARSAEDVARGPRACSYTYGQPIKCLHHHHGAGL